ncbi:helix-turn-helix domain-containing protein [Peptostreptococcus equinus]|uniref:XRE family transcriptional regulator n=1 Tax=Peptostreptococcus equinus TaxID=3003601 RepID=A0ABY7JPS5_9FIRM|nr:XRE family transcriptional regulator [Peptostreptococcus sp. CBA3647]WAW14491.1 XRE family transcriptional regulator [Peptostreptococcus sp. CBA3647]
MDIGEKVKRLRTEKQLTQEELANRCELSKGFISQLENDLTSPSIATLIDILDVLGTNLREFFAEEVNEKITFKKDDMFEVEDFDNKYTFRWLVPNSQKNDMEPVLVKIEPDGKYKEEKPHEGEEFGYVIKGTICLYMGNKKFKVRKGESFYYKPKEVHYITNEGKVPAMLIWVSSPPSF